MVTTHAVPSCPKDNLNSIGEIWYDLNLDGFASDLTATFSIVERSDRLEIELNDIHVMSIIVGSTQQNPLLIRIKTQLTNL